MIPDSLDKIETWAREYHAETEQGFGTTADNMSPLQHFLVERIYANSKGLLYDVASCLISGKGFRMPNNLISLHFFNNRLTVDELILEGQIEVFYCLPRFDPNEEKFRTFLKYNAAGAMQKYANKTYSFLERLDKGKNRRQRFEKLYVSIKHKLRKGGEIDSHFEKLTEDPEVLQDEKVAQKILTERVRKVLTTLTPEEEFIVRRRFGIGDDNDYSQEKIAEELNTPRSRVRSIEKKALKKLKYKARHLQSLLEK